MADLTGWHLNPNGSQQYTMIGDVADYIKNFHPAYHLAGAAEVGELERFTGGCRCSLPQYEVHRRGHRERGG